MLMGPRGSGKTSVAERIPSILPDLTVEQSLEVSALHSVAGALLEERGLLRRPPWFAPHHGASGASVLGGGSGRVRPGQVSLAHHGVLFLDEFPHFRADVVEALRQPLESGEVTIARGDESATYPARSLVVLAANPCPCGNYYAGGGVLPDPCECPETARRHYGRKLSGPVVDRVDIWMEVTPQGAHHGRDPLRPSESSAVIRRRVTRAREAQARRYSGRSWQLNSAVPGPVLAREWPVAPPAQALMDEALSKGEITRRGLTRVHRLAWTVADCDGVEQPGVDEVRTALALRATDSVHPLPGKVLRRAS